MLNTFYVPDEGKGSTPAMELDYYKWLMDKRLKNIHHLHTKREYLAELGFELGKDGITGDALKILKFAEEMYFQEMCTVKSSLAITETDVPALYFEMPFKPNFFLAYFRGWQGDVNGRTIYNGEGKALSPVECEFDDEQMAKLYVLEARLGEKLLGKPGFIVGFESKRVQEYMEFLGPEKVEEIMQHPLINEEVIYRKLDPVQEVFTGCTVEGLYIRLPKGQLDKPLFSKVKDQLLKMGGKWDTGKFAFKFEMDPTDLLDRVIKGDKVNLQQEFQFFGTPAALAERMVDLANLVPGEHVLEPSAGRGAIVAAINDAGLVPDVLELMPQNRQYLQNSDLKFNMVGEDFLKATGKYHKIIANPPFTKNQDIKHVMKMFDMLEDGGRLVAIMSAHWEKAQTKTTKDFRKFLADHGAEVSVIAAGEFKESGTNIETRLVVINK